MDFQKILLLLTGLSVLFFAGAVLVWLFQFIGLSLNPGLFRGANPMGILAILGILVFGGFYFLHGGFEIINRTFKK